MAPPNRLAAPKCSLFYDSSPPFTRVPLTRPAEQVASRLDGVPFRAEMTGFEQERSTYVNPSKIITPPPSPNIQASDVISTHYPSRAVPLTVISDDLEWDTHLKPLGFSIGHFSRYSAIAPYYAPNPNVWILVAPKEGQNLKDNKLGDGSLILLEDESRVNMVLAREKPVVFCRLDAIAISCQPGYHLMLGHTIFTSQAIIPSPLARAPVIVAIPNHLIDTTNFIYSIGQLSLGQHIGATPDMVRPPLRRWEVIRSVSTPGGSQLEEPLVRERMEFIKKWVQRQE